MKKLIALFSAVSLFCILTGVNAWADEPQTDVISRHAVWTKIIEDHQNNTVLPADDQSVQNSGGEQETQATVKVKIEDLPWQRVG
jgi:hypothetical protein